jgi:hypothetical protein
MSSNLSEWLIAIGTHAELVAMNIDYGMPPEKREKKKKKEDFPLSHKMKSSKRSFKRSHGTPTTNSVPHIHYPLLALALNLFLFVECIAGSD